MKSRWTYQSPRRDLFLVYLLFQLLLACPQIMADASNGRPVPCRVIVGEKQLSLQEAVAVYVKEGPRTPEKTITEHVYNQLVTKAPYCRAEDVAAELIAQGAWLPAIDGGVIHTPVNDQKAGEICWSYATAGAMESNYLREQMGKDPILAHLVAESNEAYQELSAPGPMQPSPAAQLELKKLRLDQAVAHFVSDVATDTNLPTRALRVLPEHLLFYHIYDQIATHLDFYYKEARKHVGEKMTPAQLRNVVDNLPFQPDVGGGESSALRELLLGGVVPEGAVVPGKLRQAIGTLKISDPLRSLQGLRASSLKSIAHRFSWSFLEQDGRPLDAQGEMRIEQGLPEFILQKLFNVSSEDDLEKNYRRYRNGLQDLSAAVNADAVIENGINKNLFDDLNDFFKDRIGYVALLPNEQFYYAGVADGVSGGLNPISFMRQVLKFDPCAWEPVDPSANPASSHRSAVLALKVALDGGYASPIGFPELRPAPSEVMDEITERDVRIRVNQSGIFDGNMCPQGEPCTWYDGGHETLAVNYLFERGDSTKFPVAFIVKNSYGTERSLRNPNGGVESRHHSFGLVGDGRGPRHETGYYILTENFLRQSLDVANPDAFSWDLLVPKGTVDELVHQGNPRPERLGAELRSCR